MFVIMCFVLPNEKCELQDYARGGHLTGTHGRDTWQGHMAGTYDRDT